MRRSRNVIGCLLLVAGLLGCDGSPAPAAAAEPEPAPAVATPKVVSRIVFVDKQECCDCTRKAIDESWAALREALGPDHGLALERVFIDQETARADELRALRPLVTVPGIYFLDAASRVVELLQGTVTAQEIRAVLPAAKASPQPSPSTPSPPQDPPKEAAP